MPPLKVTVTRKIPEPGIHLLRREGFQLRYNDEDRALSRAELIEAITGADGVICMLHDGIDAEVLDAAPSVRVYSNFAVGFNNIDLEGCRKRGVRVTNTPGVLT